MVFIGIDIAKDKHDCHITNSDGEILCDNFSFRNSKCGFEQFLKLVNEQAAGNKVKIGLEATGDYSTNLLSFLKINGFDVVLFNPLSVNRAKSASTLRRTKTDKCDARYIAEMLPLATPLQRREITALNCPT
ncbi:MAG: IS110 family transposase [Clostridiales bacterium]|jgi:transposase|nr:IS110 family transposase [Clostridiales bacterium]